MGLNQGPISLDQKYSQSTGHVFMTGIQALVRLPMAQIRRDRAAGLNTAGFISGYRGSPLGGYDQQLFAARKHLEQYNIKFQPGVNEDLAATAIWGSQQLHLSPGARHDGVVGIWYGKGPGVDRCGDVFRHGNTAGSAKHGGVLCLAGDDHGAKSSTVPHQSDHAFISALMPYLYPSSIHEMIEMGLLGIAMSRYSGCWVGMKTITETVETTAEIDLSRGLDRLGDHLHADPAAGIARHRNAEQAHLDHFMDAGGIEVGHQGGDEGVVRLVRDGGGFCAVVVAGKAEHAAIFRRTRSVAVAEHVAAAVDAGALAVPDADHAIMIGTGRQIELLAAPDRGRGEVLVHARLKLDVVLLEVFSRGEELLVVAAER